MPLDLLLTNGVVILDGIEVKRSVGILSDKIEGVYLPGKEPVAHDTLECADCYILPGMVDIHVHLRDLNCSSKEDYESGTMAAAAGGVTTVVDMPNSSPPVLDADVLDKKMQSARQKRFVNVGFYSGIPMAPEEYDTAMVPSILGFKVYPHSPLAKGVRFTDNHIRKCMSLARLHDRPLLFHPDSSSPDSKPRSMDEYFQIHSCEGEHESARRFIEAKMAIGGRLHVCHVSCASTARLILENRAEETLSAEVTPHHLFLNSGGFSNENGHAKMLPPLRSPYDNEALLTMLCGKCAIDCVASDHAPHTDEEKSAPFLDAASGIPGLETTVPLMLTEVFERRLTWVDYLRVCCSGPARVLGLKSKGILSRGFDADLIVVRREEHTIRGHDFFSKAKITPFEGRRVLGKVVRTIVGGHTVYDNGRFVVGRGVVGSVPVRKY
ncbi:MAG: dihydroorotase family protein [Candidatus Thorarchaeota archaeon]|nr:dihydroorotase family protein [Candidatus Thorarchaeota archaeon]